VADQLNENLPRGDPAGNGTPNRIGRLFIGCCALVFLLGVLILIVCAIVGLTTGYLFFPGRGGTLELYGVWARTVSAMILLFIATLVFMIFRGKKKNRRPKILGESDYQ
jgi:uncharacterized membrane protein